MKFTTAIWRNFQQNQKESQWPSAQWHKTKSYPLGDEIKTLRKSGIGIIQLSTVSTYLKFRPSQGSAKSIWKSTQYTSHQRGTCLYFANNGVLNKYIYNKPNPIKNTKDWWSVSPLIVGCMRQALGPGALGRPGGSGWRGRCEGGSGWGRHVNSRPFHFNVWQNSLQIKKKRKKIYIMALKKK